MKESPTSLAKCVSDVVAMSRTMIVFVFKGYWLLIRAAREIRVRMRYCCDGTASSDDLGRKDLGWALE